MRAEATAEGTTNHTPGTCSKAAMRGRQTVRLRAAPGMNAPVVMELPAGPRVHLVCAPGEAAMVRGGRRCDVATTDG